MENLKELEWEYGTPGIREHKVRSALRREKRAKAFYGCGVPEAMLMVRERHPHGRADLLKRD